jgi:dihydrolipoamide dehydrogenase
MDSARPSDEVGAAVADNQSDLVILGGGSGGYAAALRAAELGKSVVLIERDKVGGTCLHRGCIPTKALLHAGEIADQAREAAQFGVNATFEGIDMAGVHKYKDGVVSKNHKGLVGLITGRGIQIVEGDGRLSGPKTVTVNDDTYTGANVILATGSYSRTLPGLDLDGQRVIASEHALRLDHVPASAIVLGGGVIGVEFASAWRSFGSDVTIVEALPHLVPLEDEASSKLLERAFRRRGIAHHLGARFEQRLKRERDLVDDRAPGVHEAILRQVADGQGRGARDGACVRLIESREHAEQRGFSSAVRTAQPDPFTIRHLPRDGIEQDALAEGLGEGLELDHLQRRGC